MTAREIQRADVRRPMSPVARSASSRIRGTIVRNRMRKAQLLVAGIALWIVWGLRQWLELERTAWTTSSDYVLLALALLVTVAGLIASVVRMRGELRRNRELA